MHGIYSRARQRQRQDADAEHWLVFDDDRRPGTRDVVSEAAAAGIRVAVSNPCFELWLLLHHQDQTANMGAEAAQRAWRDVAGPGKDIVATDLDDLVERLPDACRRAQALDRKHAQDGSPEASNPSSGVWRLIARLDELAGRKMLGG